MPTLTDRAKLAHKHSSNHRNELIRSKVCGCFYCGKRFPPSEIKDWVTALRAMKAQGETALCPHCGIDSVIGDASPFEPTTELLGEMSLIWFDEPFGQEPLGANA